jgi:DNA-binding protein HU-beta
VVAIHTAAITGNQINRYSKGELKMTKAEFVVKFAEKTGLSKKDAANAVNAFFEVTADALKAGDKVVFPGTFKAEVAQRAARTGRNPLTGAEMQIPAKKVVKAKLSDKLLG